jgi:Family of unknown function (DUF6461)
VDTAAADIGRLAWFDAFEPLCFTLLEGVDEDEAIRRFGGDPAATELHGPELYDDLLADRDYATEPLSLLQVGTAETGHVFAIETNGWTGINALPGLSRDGARAFTVYTHVNGADRTGYAVDGRHVVDEEPWGPLTALSDPDPAWDPAWCAGLSDVEHEQWLRGARQLVLAERVMGTRIDPRWFEIPLRSVELPDPFENPVLGLGG